LVVGCVEVKQGDQQIMMEPGEQLRYQDGKFRKTKVAAEKAVAWKSNKLVFEGVEFAEIVRRLERWYGVEIIVENERLLKHNFTGAFKNEETIFQVLDAMQYFLEFQYDNKEFRKVIIK
jgi:ferric-dicitrate binding protein FerR (iron transport regulator)